MPVFRFDKAYDIARGVKAFLNPWGDVARGAGRADRQPAEARRLAAEHKKRLRREIRSQERRLSRANKEHLKRLRREIRNQRRRLSRANREYLAAKDGAESIKHKKTKKIAQQEIFKLERQLCAAQDGVAVESAMGALPDFVIIGTMKGGTTRFYRFLTQHPLVEPATSKEPHFFNDLFDEGVEWYRNCFLQPRSKDGRKTITGEATPSYLFHPHAPKRMAEVIPHARLIALLRNPVDRAYSHYQMMVRRGFEHLSFDEAVEAEEARLRGERDRLLEDEHYAAFNLEHFSYLSRGIYVDQLLHWSKVFAKEQMLVLKSEDFFERPQETLNLVLGFLDLPDWESASWKSGSKKRYEKMDLATRRRLGEHFEPHNRRLYNFLGMDFGW